MFNSTGTPGYIPTILTGAFATSMLGTSIGNSHASTASRAVEGVLGGAMAALTAAMVVQIATAPKAAAASGGPQTLGHDAVAAKTSQSEAHGFIPPIH